MKPWDHLTFEQETISQPKNEIYFNNMKKVNVTSPKTFFFIFPCTYL